MRVTIEKCTPGGEVFAPPSKSMAHRMLICAGLAEGKSVIHGIAPSQDVLATLDCLNAMGVEYSYEKDTVVIFGKGKPTEVKEPLKCRESGSTLRFFLPLCMNGYGKATLYGSETLLKRPLGIYVDICKKQNIEFNNDGEKITVSGKLGSGEYDVCGNISSQFITGLLFALPLSDGNSVIKILPPIESLSYINLTLKALNEFGIDAGWRDENTLYIKGNQHYKPHETTVEGDYSNAAFFDALNSLGADVKVLGLDENSLQGDKVYKELFKKLENGTEEIDISDCPDLGPVLFAVAAAKKGGFFTGTKRLRIKESDRANAMAEELLKFGISVFVEENCVKVISSKLCKPKKALYGHNDHRIVMALSVLLTLTGGSIDGAEAVNKSMPDFFEKLQRLGVGMNYETVC